MTILWDVCFVYLFIFLKGRIECNSFDSDNDFSRGKTDCTIDKPIFQSNNKVGSMYTKIASYCCRGSPAKEQAT